MSRKFLSTTAICLALVSSVLPSYATEKATVVPACTSAYLRSVGQPLLLPPYVHVIQISRTLTPIWLQIIVINVKYILHF